MGQLGLKRRAINVNRGESFDVEGNIVDRLSIGELNGLAPGAGYWIDAPEMMAPIVAKVARVTHKKARAALEGAVGVALLFQVAGLEEKALGPADAVSIRNGRIPLASLTAARAGGWRPSEPPADTEAQAAPRRAAERRRRGARAASARLSRPPTPTGKPPRAPPRPPALPRRLREPVALRAEPLSRRPGRACDRGQARRDTYGRHPRNGRLLHAPGRIALSMPLRGWVEQSLAAPAAVKPRCRRPRDRHRSLPPVRSGQQMKRNWISLLFFGQMKGKWASLLVAGLLACGLFWNQTRREKLVLQAWCQENGLHIKAVHWTWRWEAGPFDLDWTGHSPLPRETGRGNIYQFEAVRDGETATQVYWAIITLWRGQMEVAVETPAHRYVHVGTGRFPKSVF